VGRSPIAAFVAVALVAATVAQRFRIVAALAGVALLAAPPGAQTSLVQRYVAALGERRYADAFAMLDDAGRAYYRNPVDFASGFNADGAAVLSATFTGVRGDAAFRVYFVRETLRLHDPLTDTTGTTTVTIPYGVAGANGSAHIKDLGRPWRARALYTAKTGSGLRVTVHKIAFYEHAIAIVATFANLGPGFLTVMPYGRSVLRDDAGAVYAPIVNTTWTQTDKRLFLGAHLAANAQIGGVLTFASPRLDDRVRTFTLTIAPNVRDGSAAPFSVDVSNIGPPS
jgi:hypothetical protein